jgi:hypothetical protein
VIASVIVPAGERRRTGAQRRLGAVGSAYLEFARTEPGLFDTAFATMEHPLHSAAGDDPGPFDLLKSALDELVEAGALELARRPSVEYPIWATVHGLAVLFRGPLRHMPDRDKSQLEAQALQGNFWRANGRMSWSRIIGPMPCVPLL